MPSASPAVHADGVSKMFHRGERHDSLRDLIPALLRRGGRGAAAGALRANDFWAVDDVGFDVEFGRALGIIGPNGAGKSTMLKLLTGVLRPTRGEIRMRGRVASLIEVSAGFHQDLTGRENVYLQGAILGMTRREVDRRLDSIIDFSGIEPFIDTPVKRYSSGMNARLGFAIAVHLEPDVLVIDEVLSVGDVSFQQKCVERMRQFKRDGVAIVFVSHNMQSVGELCDEAIVLKSSVRYRGPVGGAVTEYLALTTGSTASLGRGQGVHLVGSRLVDAAGQTAPEGVAPGARLRLEVDLEVDEQLPAGLHYSMLVRRATDSVVAYDGSYEDTELGLPPLAPGQRVRLHFDHVLNLVRGQYAYEFNVYEPAVAGHRLWVGPVAGVRVDEFRTYGGLADLAVTASAQVVAGVRGVAA